MPEKVSFEENLKKLQEIVNRLESGDVPLDQAMKQFKDGVKLSNTLQGDLSHSKRTLAKVVTNDGQEVPYERDRNGQDIDNNVTEDDNPLR